MRRTIILYALALATLTFLLKVLEFRYMIRDLSIEFYVGVIAVLFSGIGVWAGLKLTRKKVIVVNAPPSDFLVDETNLRQLGISKREHEVLDLMARGLTNREIAEKLFVSDNTVKTHLSSLFVKLDVKRRTQAVTRARELRLIP